MKLLFSLSLLIFLIQSIFAITPDEFSQVFREQYTSATPLSEEVHTYAKNLRYVFIAGFLNEGVPAYFEDNKKALIAAGVSEKHIHSLYPSSTDSIRKNVEYVRDELWKIAERKSEKLVIIGHSKGAAEALAFAIQYESFVSECVEAIFLIQGAIGGSGVADYLKGNGIAVDEKMPLRERIQFLTAFTAGAVFKPIINSGLRSLTHEKAKNYWPALLENHAKSIPKITHKIYYIVSSEHPSKISDIIDFTGWYLHTYYGKNDGLLTLSDQVLEGIGTQLIELEADHADLTVTSFISNTPEKLRYALTQAILIALAQ